MNERIKELALQASIFAEAEYAKQTIATFDTNKSTQELYEEKFAELIVREYIFHGILSIARNHPDGRVVTISFKTSKDATEFEQHAIESTKNISE